MERDVVFILFQRCVTWPRARRMLFLIVYYPSSISYSIIGLSVMNISRNYAELGVFASVSNENECFRFLNIHWLCWEILNWLITVELNKEIISFCRWYTVDVDFAASCFAFIRAKAI